MTVFKIPAASGPPNRVSFQPPSSSTISAARRLGFTDTAKSLQDLRASLKRLKPDPSPAAHELDAANKTLHRVKDALEADLLPVSMVTALCVSEASVYPRPEERIRIGPNQPPRPMAPSRMKLARAAVSRLFGGSSRFVTSEDLCAEATDAVRLIVSELKTLQGQLAGAMGTPDKN